MFTACRRSQLLLCLCLPLLFCLHGCDRPPKPIKLGLAINLSGRGGTAGGYIRDGALLAVDDCNASGGINGHPLELIVKDDRNTEEGIIAADRELIEAGVVAIIGHSYSQNTLTAYPLVTGRHTLLFTAYTGTTALSGKDDLFFRTAVDNRAYGKALAALLNKRGIGSIAVLLDMSNPSFVEDYLKETAKHYGGTMHAVRYNSKEAIDWPQVVAGLLAPQPEAIVLLTEVTGTGIACQKLRGRGFTGDLIATTWAQTPDLPRYGSTAVEGLTLITFIDPALDTPGYRAFADKMEARFAKPATARSVRAYEAVQILSQTLAACPFPPTAGDLKKALLGRSFDTLMGSLRFDPYGDVVRPIFAVRIEAGRFVNTGAIL